ncbi:MAG: Ig-like domain-containing protein [Bacteroidales bacterium]
MFNLINQIFGTGNGEYYNISYLHYKDNGDCVLDDFIAQSSLGVGQYDSKWTIQAEWYFAASDGTSKRENSSGFELRDLGENTYLYYPNIRNMVANSPISFRVSSANSDGGIIEIREGSTTGTLLGSCAVPNTGSWTNYQTLNCELSNSVGDKNIYLVFKGTGTELMRLDYFKVEGGDPPVQEPYSGSNRTIPGSIEAEHYDLGGESIAYHDDDTKEGDATQRPLDNVDIINNSEASNGYVVGHSQSGEWLEYTVDVTSGNYNISLFYFCGETAGDLVVSLGREIISTFSGMQNKGWDKRDSLCVENILLTSSGKKILKLEFVNGAGFDIDAIKFVKQTVDVSSVNLSNCPNSGLSVGDTQQLTANVSPADADDPSVNWSSSDITVATVDESGLITAISDGAATITVTTNDGGLSDQCEVEISKAVISVNGVAIDDCPSILFHAGETFQFTATVFPDDADDKSVSWSSSNTSVATVDSSGFLTIVSMGNSIIKVTTNDGGYSAQCIVLVDGSEVIGAILTNRQSGVIKVYPNPTSIKLHFDLPESTSEKHIKIFNTRGQLLISENTFETHFEIDVEKFKAEELLIAHIVFDQNSVYKKVLLER